MIIDRNHALVSPDGLAAVTRMGDASIASNSSMLHLDLDQLETVGDLVISGTLSLSSLAGLECLHTIGGIFSSRTMMP